MRLLGFYRSVRLCTRRAGLRPWAAGALVLAMLSATAAWAAPQPTAPVRLDAQESSGCSDLRIAARGPQQMAVGWLVSEGPAQGVYLRRSKEHVFGPVQKIFGPVGEAARDLALAMTAQGEVFLAWTALQPDGQRLLMAAQTASSDPLITAAPLAVEQPGEQADFPALLADTQGQLTLVWQETRQWRPLIRAVQVSPQGELSDLGAICPPQLYGMAPQILSAAPLRVAWYQINEIGSQLRVDRWWADQGRWRPDVLELQGKAFDSQSQVLLALTQDENLVGVWTALDEEGRTALNLGGAWNSVCDQPAGDHASPTLSLSAASERLTVAWLVQSEGRQQLYLRPWLPGAQSQAQPTVRISPPDHHFAAAPDHVTLGSWSAVVWTDDTREGGQGGVWLSEINWPSDR